MENKYFDEVAKLLKQIRPRLTATYRLSFKNVFGAVAGYVNGRIFISCGKFGVALKLPPEVIEDLFKKKGVKPLKYFPNGHIKKEYAILPKRILEDSNQFRKLIYKSVQYVLLF